MKTQIRAKLGQQQKISMQLQHAMRLMAMPVLELQAHLDAMLDENPLLEVEYAEPIFTAGMREPVAYANDMDWLAQAHATMSLQDHLNAQCALLSLGPEATVIAQTLIDSIDETGYLQLELDSLFADKQEKQHLVRGVLHQIQQFDPPGVAARNLTECLMLQLPHTQAEDEIIQVANQIIHHHMKALAQNDVKQLSDKLNKPVTLIKKAIKTIKQCHPKPGLQIGTVNVENIVPDVIVKEEDGEISLLINTPVSHIKINSNVSQDIDKEQIKVAKDFIYHLHMRNQTLFDVAQSIINHQREFFLKGPSALKPLTLEQVATDTDLNVSTVSRMTQQKYFHTPFGVKSMKFFFSSGMHTNEGEAIANTVIQQLISEFIAGEDKTKPLSDSKIVDFLTEKGYPIARRTVAKYRDEMNIPPSALRKRLD